MMPYLLFSLDAFWRVHLFLFQTIRSLSMVSVDVLDHQIIDAGTIFWSRTGYFWFFSVTRDLKRNSFRGNIDVTDSYVPFLYRTKGLCYCPAFEYMNI